MKKCLSSHIAVLFIVVLGFGCFNNELPKLGTFDTDFTLTNQDGAIITQKTLENKIYVTDFFFTSCPTICPKMTSQMLRIYEVFKGDKDVLLVSHSIDPTYDTVEVLSDYADRLDVKSDNWYFLTGDKSLIYDLADAYMVTAMEDETAPGGYAHSGAFILLDKNKQIRGTYDGTVSEEVDLLIKDIKKLKNAYQ